MTRFLLMDSEQTFRENLTLQLEEKGFQTIAFSAPSAATFHLKRHRVDAVLWEWNQTTTQENENPSHAQTKGTGNQAKKENAIQQIREAFHFIQQMGHQPCPWVILTHIGQEAPIRNQLIAEVQEYLFKSLPMEELVFRIKRLTHPATLQVGPMLLDLSNHEIIFPNTIAPLSQSECDVLSRLMAYPGQTISTEELAIAFCPNTIKRRQLNTKDYIRQVIYQLRKKIEYSGGKKDWIKNNRARGYKLQIHSG